MTGFVGGWIIKLPEVQADYRRRVTHSHVSLCGWLGRGEIFTCMAVLPLHLSPENYNITLAKIKGGEILWTKISSKIQTD